MCYAKSYFYGKRGNMSLYHFSERRVFAEENTKGAHGKTSVITPLTKFIYFSFLRTALPLR